MVTIAVLAVLAVALTGLAVKFGLQFASQREMISGRRVTWLEYGVALTVATVIVVPAVLGIGKSLSVDQILQYDEMYNGVEVSAGISPVACHAGHAGRNSSAGRSNCKYEYDTGVQYSWDETYTVTECTSDGKGGQTCSPVQKCCVTYTANIYAPYAKTEYTFSVTNSLDGLKKYDGVYNYPGVYLAANPEPYGGRAIPANIPRGAPADWLEAKQRLDAGDPRPVTAMFAYDNYILASQDKALAPFAGDVQGYLEKGLLPDHTASILKKPIYGGPRSQAKKLNFVGMGVSNENEWQESLMRFNAALGSKFQGDLHVVVINSTLIDNPQRYLKALRAYWLGEHFKKRALSKNGIILVIGANQGKVEWAQADTGMPFGNNVMLRSMENFLAGTALTPDAVFGKPRTVANPAAKKVDVSFSAPMGVLEDVMLARPESQFKRPCMLCEDDEDAGGVGYKNLIAQIEPTATQKTWMVIIIWLISLLFWSGVAATSFLERWSPSRRSVQDRRTTHSFN